MNSILYEKVRISARYCRDLEVRKKICLFLEVIQTGKVLASCNKFGVCRRSYSRWWKNYCRADYKVEALMPRSRKPEDSKSKRSAYLVKIIRHYRLRYRYGPERILNYLKLNHRLQVSESTIRRVIEEQGWIIRKNKTKKKNPHKKRYNLEWPGHMQMDIKYVPQKIDGEQYYVFNAIDDCTRWRYFRAYKEKTAINAVYFVRELVKYAPFKILSIQTDNDVAFTYRLNPFVYDKDHIFGSNLKELGIRHRLIPPGAKELNGKVERSHRTDDEEFFWKAPMKDFDELQGSLVAWWFEYNQDRPHSGINGLTPLQKWAERFMTSFMALNLKNIYPQLQNQYKKTRHDLLDTYLKYLNWIQTDPFHGTDVLNYYI